MHYYILRNIRVIRLSNWPGSSIFLIAKSAVVEIYLSDLQ